MNLEGSKQLAAPRNEVWRLLEDEEVLKACIPGCETLTRVGSDEFQAVVLAKVGPVQARFNGSLKRFDAVVPERFSLAGQGQGGMAGFGKMTAHITLQDMPGGTQLNFTSEAQVGGKLAQVGSRLVDVAAERFNTEFFHRFEALIAERTTVPGTSPTPSAPASPAPTEAAGPWAMLMAQLARWFGRT